MSRRGLLTRCVITAVVVSMLGACAQEEDVKFQGRWKSDKSSVITLYLYPDGTASVSGTGFLNLKWKKVSDKMVKIEILDRKFVFHFNVSRDNSGLYGVLELAGFETMRFRPD